MSSPSQTPSDDGPTSESHADRRDRYRSILGAIHHNTGDPQYPVVTASALWTIVRHSNLSVRKATSSLKASRDNDHVIRWKNGDGKPCYGLTESAYDEIPHCDAHGFGPEDVDALREMIEVEASRPEPDQDLIGWCNTRLAEINREDSDDV